MDLTPGEKGLLTQIRLLYEAAGRDQPLRALTASWPPVHYQSYRSAYVGLVAKRLLQDNNQSFRITDIGLAAIGATPLAAPRKPEPRPVRRAQPQVAPKAPASVMSRLVNGLLGRR